MNSIALISIFCGLIAAVSWGTADFFAAKASKRNSPEATALWVSIIGVFTYTIIFLFNQGQIGWPHLGVLFAVAAGVSLELGILTFYRGLDSGPVSAVSPISSAYPIVTTLIVVLIFKGSLSPVETAGILVVVAGIILTSGLLELKNAEKKLTPGVAYALLTFLLWGMAYALLGRSVAILGWEKSTLVDFWAGSIALFITLNFTAGRKIGSYLKEKYYKDKYVIGAGLIQLIGGIVFSIGLKHSSSTAVITAVSATYPALTIFLAIRNLSEKKRLWRLVGAFVTIGGVIILIV